MNKYQKPLKDQCLKTPAAIWFRSMAVATLFIRETSECIVEWLLRKPN